MRYHCASARLDDSVEFWYAHSPLVRTTTISSLVAGDPTIFGNLACPESAVESVIEQVKGGKANGYPHAAGV